MAVVIAVFVMALVWRDRPFSSPDLAVMARILLSLAVGILGATIPGFLNVKLDANGVVIRAAGGLALFLITYFFSPKVEPLHLRAPDLAFAPSPALDLRTVEAPDQDEAKRLSADAVATVPISIRNTAEPSRTGFLDQVTIEFSVDQTIRKFKWRYFVNMHQEQDGLWLAIQSDATAKPVKAGDIVSLEVMATADPPLSWGTLLSDIEKSEVALAYVKVAYAYSAGEDRQSFMVETRCRVDLALWREQIKSFRETTGRVPGRVTMPCDPEVSA